MKILITGGSKGIGAAFVKLLREQGHTVAVLSRTRAECDYWQECDLLSYSGNAVKDVFEHLDGLDVLVNNAGIQDHCKFIDQPLVKWNEQLNMMLTIPFILSQQFVRLVKYGHIVNILSVAAFQGARNVAPYVAAKHGLLGLTRSMAIELAPDIHVNAIAPGLTDTYMTSIIEPERRAFLDSITPLGRFCEPEEIAGALTYLINSTAVYGQTITVDGGWMVKNG